MSKKLEELLDREDIRYLIKNANKIEDPEKYRREFEEMSKLLRKIDAPFKYIINRFRLPIKEILKYLNLDDILVKKGCSYIGNLLIVTKLKIDHYVSNVVDIVCNKDTLHEQEKTALEYISRYDYEFLPSTTFGFVIDNKLIIPNYYGIYEYILLRLNNNLPLYIILGAEGNIYIKKGKISETIYFEDPILISLLYKFYRSHERDWYDLNMYEDKNPHELKRIIEMGISENDLEKALKLFDKKDLEKILSRIEEYMKRNPNTVYQGLISIVERIIEKLKSKYK